MTVPKATNTYVFIIRDEVQKKLNDMILPDRGRVKPHQGEIFSIGGKVSDPDIKKSKGRKGVFHAGIGQEVEIEGQTYLCLQEHEIIAVL